VSGDPYTGTGQLERIGVRVRTAARVVAGVRASVALAS